MIQESPVQSGAVDRSAVPDASRGCRVFVVEVVGQQSAFTVKTVATVGVCQDSAIIHPAVDGHGICQLIDMLQIGAFGLRKCIDLAEKAAICTSQVMIGMVIDAIGMKAANGWFVSFVEALDQGLVAG